MKHLNPRQGITTPENRCRFHAGSGCRQCETPKSPPGDYNAIACLLGRCAAVDACETPKSPPGDYNHPCCIDACACLHSSCETPKSPPGDYNPMKKSSTLSASGTSRCETPKSPPGDYNMFVVQHPVQERLGTCETPKSPPGDYNDGHCLPPWALRCRGV